MLTWCREARVGEGAQVDQAEDRQRGGMFLGGGEPLGQPVVGLAAGQGHVDQPRGDLRRIERPDQQARRLAQPDLRQEIADDVEAEALAGLVGLADADVGQQVLDDMAEAPARLRASPATLRGEGALNRGVGVRRHGIIMTVRRDIRGSVDCRRIVSIIRLEDKLRVTRNLLGPVLAQPFAPWPRA